MGLGTFLEERLLLVGQQASAAIVIGLRIDFSLGEHPLIVKTKAAYLEGRYVGQSQLLFLRCLPRKMLLQVKCVRVQIKASD